MRHSRRFPADPKSVPAARRFANDTLAGASPDLREAVELMVSELVTNCVRHVHAGFELTILRTDEEIRVEVTDGAGGQPTMRSPGPEEPSGRGLRIVDMLSSRWGVSHDLGVGKTVWFTVADSSRSSGVSETASQTSGGGRASAEMSGRSKTRTLVSPRRGTCPWASLATPHRRVRGSIGPISHR